MFKSTKRLFLLATVFTAAILPTVASARPDTLDRPYSDAAAAVQAATPPAAALPSTSTSGFSWHDAAFGAAGMLVLIGVGTGTVLAVRRRAILS